MSTDYNITYIITDQQGQKSKKELVGRINYENIPNLDTVFGYIARRELELEKAQELLITLRPFGGMDKTFPELSHTPIKQLLKRLGLKQTLSATKPLKALINITVEIGAASNPIAANYEISGEGLTSLPPEFLQAIKLAESGDLGVVRRVLEAQGYECAVTW
jgi:hypothetical protein